jgi:hypothetical protein
LALVKGTLGLENRRLPRKGKKKSRDIRSGKQLYIKNAIEVHAERHKTLLGAGGFDFAVVREKLNYIVQSKGSMACET